MHFENYKSVYIAFQFWPLQPQFPIKKIGVIKDKQKFDMGGGGFIVQDCVQQGGGTFFCRKS